MSDEKTCGCGCGQVPPSATRNDPRRGHVKGEPLEFCPGHQLNPVAPGSSVGDVGEGGSLPVVEPGLADLMESLLRRKLDSATAATLARALPLAREMESRQASTAERDREVVELSDLLRERVKNRGPLDDHLRGLVRTEYARQLAQMGGLVELMREWKMPLPGLDPALAAEALAWHRATARAKVAP